MTLEQLNQLGPEACIDTLRRCCVSTRWLEGMEAARPFATGDALYDSAARIWSELSMPDYLEAFEGHPKSGDLASLQAWYADSKTQAAAEQSAAVEASEQVLSALAEANREYEARFGFNFILCSSGKPAQEMLTLLNQRLDNDLISELAIAAAEQAKITRLRLEQLLDEQ
ncbi:2-oxo-4-hydroxy-4-carboxy-5-ureidoimidazoline decarboxylase [Marinobacterium zhoushanense]|uniref:2-oxo-4-hydroxy-4-carboxy-5-ureidoimidazoline decarboxylase n=1 Tax=Marinobacterium zhoushanense TaxID=1679163 RepID=A0ABQ1KCI9_9GAMM|nr:2-oxo-4-hydroxy-4-carboxy-5-ureidoimidazoline decarboxylase [Marinobacterium zhoushanense]GGB92277.1 2-oxo-4-hydroxy-4-carboxy-5-ureidoimidazoline decarboxylase [Marinobacterium zhoushanense]